MSNAKYFILKPISDDFHAYRSETLPSELKPVVKNSGFFIVYCDESAPPDLEIPARIDGKRVVAVAGMSTDDKGRGPTVMGKNTRLKSVVVHSGIKMIGRMSFSECLNLEKIHLPDSLQAIEEFAFVSCHKLSEIYFPRSIKTIGMYAFAYCRSLRYVTVPGSIAEIPRNCFSGCYNLQRIEVEEGVQRIGEEAFSRCGNRENVPFSLFVYIPPSIEYIHDSVFKECPDIVLEVNENSYALQWALQHGFTASNGYGRRIQLRNPVVSTMQEDGRMAKWEVKKFFEGRLHAVSLEAYLTPEIPITTFPTSIGGQAIESLTRESISYCYRDCRDPLTNTRVLNNLRITRIPDGIRRLGQGMFAQEGDFYLFKIQLPQSLEIISDRCFAGQPLNEIVLPSRIGLIGERAFFRCDRLQEIKLPESLKCIDKETFAQCRSLKMVDIRLGTRSIAEGAFSNCVNLEVVWIPPSVESIHPTAFENCRKLTIYCLEGSYAHFFAISNGIGFNTRW